MSKPYVISMMSAPVALERIAVSLAWMLRRSQQKGHVQLGMTKKVVGCLSKTRDEATGIFTLMIVKVRDSLHVEEFVEEPTSLPPSGSIANSGNAPRVGIHA